MRKIYFLSFIVSCFVINNSFAQVVLEADGVTDTYELINSVLAPGYDVIESPDNSCGENAAFGYHIKQELDSELNDDVFAFYIFVDENSDRCQNYDRQRNEIKTYDKSPDNLLGIEGETVIYKWKFKLPAGMQYTSRFTHVHQIKPVGGYDSQPLFTLTVAGSSSGQLRLRYSQISESQSTLHAEDIDDFLGVWVEATEQITYGTSGSYDIQINRISDGASLFSYSNTNIQTWRLGDAANSNEDNELMRPKWGIYRSLGSADPNDSASVRDELRDEVVLFADFSIEETVALSTNDFDQETSDIFAFPNPSTDFIQFSPATVSKYNEFSIYNAQGKLVLQQELTSEKVAIKNLASGLYIIDLATNGQKIDSIKFVKK